MMNRISRLMEPMLAPLAGVSLTLTFAPYDWCYLALPALMVFYWQSYRLSYQSAAWRGYLFGLGLFASGIWWVYISIHDFGGADPLSASLLAGLLVAFLALFPALTAMTLVRVFRLPGAWKRITWASLVWVTIEYLRGYLLLNGFPWLQIAYSQLQTPLAGFAPLVGVYGVGYLLAASAFMSVELVLRRLNLRQGMLCLLMIWGSGALLRTVGWTQPMGEAFTVTLVQGNIGQDQKWLPDQKLNTLKLYQQLTEQHWDSDVIIWPETAVPAFLSQVKTFFLDPLAAKAREHGTDLVISLPSGGDKTYYNSVLVLSDSETLYHKNHLLPFGEYLPLQPLSGWVLDQLQIPLGSFTAGADRQRLLNAAGYPFITTICYEDAFGEQVIRQVKDAAYLVNVTNDAWFGQTSEPYQHMQMAQMRALETGRYLVRATNTGASGFVGPDGVLRKMAPLFTTTTLTDSIVPMSGVTPYARLGDTGAFLLIGLLVLIVTFVERRIQAF